MFFLKQENERAAGFVSELLSFMKEAFLDESHIHKWEPDDNWYQKVPRGTGKTAKESPKVGNRLGSLFQLRTVEGTWYVQSKKEKAEEWHGSSLPMHEGKSQSRDYELFLHCTLEQEKNLGGHLWVDP